MENMYGEWETLKTGIGPTDRIVFRDKLTNLYVAEIIPTESDSPRRIARAAAIIGIAPELADTLETLMDYQNGCPLPSYEASWTEAMENGRRLLSEINKII